MKGEEKSEEVAPFLLLLWIMESKGRAVAEQETSKTSAQFLKRVPYCVDDRSLREGKLRLLLVEIIKAWSSFRTLQCTILTITVFY